MINSGKMKGSLVGLAVGDSVGAAVEFCPPGTFEPVQDMLGVGPFLLCITGKPSLIYPKTNSILHLTGKSPLISLVTRLRTRHLI